MQCFFYFYYYRYYMVYRYHQDWFKLYHNFIDIFFFRAPNTLYCLKISFINVKIRKFSLFCFAFLLPVFVCFVYFLIIFLCCSIFESLIYIARLIWFRLKYSDISIFCCCFFFFQFVLLCYLCCSPWALNNWTNFFHSDDFGRWNESDLNYFYFFLPFLYFLLVFILSISFFFINYLFLMLLLLFLFIFWFNRKYILSFFSYFPL